MKNLKFICALASICGCALGTGFITLTAEVGQAGFWWATLALVLIWVLGIISGQLYTEAFLAVPDAPHYHSLSRKLNSIWNSRIISASFLLYSYLSLIYYIIFIRDVMRMIIEYYNLQTTFLPQNFMWPFAIVVGAIVFFGRLSTFMTVALLMAIFFLFLGYEVSYSPLSTLPSSKTAAQFIFFFSGIGTIFNLTFYQTLMPSVVQFLKHDRKRILAAIWIGWTLAMAFMLLWMWLTFRPEIYGKFLAAYEIKTSFHGALSFLQEISQFKYLVRVLALSSGIISILCLALPMKDFFEDALQRFLPDRTFLKKLLIILLVFVPAYLTSRVSHTTIILFINIAAVFTEYLLATIYPLTWVWNIRYHLRIPIKPILRGGKPMLISLTFASIILLFILITVPINQLYW